MTEKRKSRDKEGHSHFKKKRISSKKNNNGGKGQGGKKRGPGLPNQLRKEINILDQTQHSDNDDDINFDGDLYEYEEEDALEDLKKTHQFDPVENLQYELPDDFKDENVASDEDDEVNSDKDDLEEDNERHARMLKDITGLPSGAFEGKRKKDRVVSEAYPESEFNPSCGILDGDGLISMEDLLGPLNRKPGFSKTNKRIKQLEKTTVHAPLRKTDEEKLTREAAYQHTKKDITKWEGPVKKNREASTIYFNENVNLGYSTVGAIAANFEPRTDFEKNMASILNDTNVVEAHRNDGARLLELNKITVEDVRDRNSHLAKMRSLLFRHEMKAKRIKKIKSKTYHKLQKKDRLKTMLTAVENDPEAAKELAIKQERKRVEERMTQKHKNKGKWARRILERGIDLQDDGTRAAISEQLQQHAELTRKMNSMNDSSSSSDDSSDNDDIDEISADSDPEGASKLLNKAKEKTLEVVEGEEELPKSGVLSLPFMVRGMEKRKKAAEEEAMLALQEYDISLEQLDKKSVVDRKMSSGPSGRRVFGAAVQKQVKEVTKANAEKIDNFYGHSDNDSEDGFVTNEDVGDKHGKVTFSQTDVNIDPDVFREESEIGHDSVFKSFEDIAKDPGLNTTYDVAIFASNSWKKKKNLPGDDVGKKIEDRQVDPVLPNHKMAEEEGDDDSDSDDGGQMVDGILSSGPKSTYELPSQEELIRRAFAADDVEEDFNKDKDEVLNEENPEPEKPVLLPGWGQWTHIQKKKGLPSWMVAEHEAAKKKREEALKKRKDAHLNHVIISEKTPKNEEKLHTKTLPFPFTSKEAFEASIRVPLGPEFNPGTAAAALIRPEVVKTSGVRIGPIKYRDVNPHERSDQKRKGSNNQKGKANGKAKGKMIKSH